jgi:hypothetical protein
MPGNADGLEIRYPGVRAFIFVALTGGHSFFFLAAFGNVIHDGMSRST